MIQHTERENSIKKECKTNLTVMKEKLGNMLSKENKKTFAFVELKKKTISE